jgi:ubiquinone/menaquinone biosynthesis C-methylase UbiE
VCDARHLSLIRNQEIDLVTSNNTFEHIYEEVLTGILKEFKRIVGPGGVMSHFIDMSDHFAHFDKSITIYNFLKFSDSEWKLIDNSIQPQNRLRINDYRKIYEELGIPITLEKNRESNIRDLESLRLDAKFEKIPIEDLAVSHSYLVSLM